MTEKVETGTQLKDDRYCTQRCGRELWNEAGIAFLYFTTQGAVNVLGRSLDGIDHITVFGL